MVNRERVARVLAHVRSAADACSRAMDNLDPRHHAAHHAPYVLRQLARAGVQLTEALAVYRPLAQDLTDATARRLFEGVSHDE